MEDDVLKTLGKKVASKLEDGDFKGVIRLACSDDRLAPFNSSTLAALQEKHPVPHLDTVIAPSPNLIHGRHKFNTSGGAILENYTLHGVAQPKVNMCSLDTG